jgi:ABC-type transporter Mla subunit MlaD
MTNGNGDRLDNLIQVVTEFSIRTQEQLQRHEERLTRSEERLDRLEDAIASINATNERLERILDRLTQ